MGEWFEIFEVLFLLFSSLIFKEKKSMDQDRQDFGFPNECPFKPKYSTGVLKVNPAGCMN